MNLAHSPAPSMSSSAKAHHGDIRLTITVGYRDYVRLHYTYQRTDTSTSF